MKTVAINILADARAAGLSPYYVADEVDSDADALFVELAVPYYVAAAARVGVDLVLGGDREPDDCRRAWGDSEAYDAALEEVHAAVDVDLYALALRAVAETAG